MSKKAINKPESSAYISAFMKGTVIGDAAREASNNNQFPLETTTLIAIGVASQICSTAYCVSKGTSNSRMPVGLYVLGEQPPGSAKTSTLECLQEGFMNSISEINKKREEVRKQIAKSEKDKKGDLDDYELKELAENQMLRLPMTDPTPEAVDESMTKTNGLFALCSTEQGLIKTMIGGAYSDGQSNKDIILKGFNGEWHASDRVSRSGFFGKPHGSMIAISQEGVIDMVLKKSDGTGLCERFLMILEGNMFGTRNPEMYGAGTYDKINDFNNIASIITNRIKKTGIEDLAMIRISKEAYRLVINQMIDIEPSLADGEKYSTSLFRGIWSKMAFQMYKVAATIHVMEGYDENKEIDKDTMTIAIAVVKSILMGMVSLCEEKGISGKNVEISKLEDYMANNAKGISGKTMRQIKDALVKHDIFKQHGKNARNKIDDAMNSLLSKGIIEKRINGSRETFIYRG
jgi:hypothetical protein